MNSKYLCFLPTALFLILFSACSTTVSTPEKIVKLNADEYNKLADAARNTLLKIPNSRISKSEKRYIEKNSPVFKVRYTGYKKGKYAFRWETNSGKTLQVFGRGNMRDFRDSFKKISIVSVKVNKSKDDPS